MQICKFADGLGEQRYYLQRSRSKRSDESELEYANDSLTLVVKTSTDLKVLSPDDVAFRLNTNNISAQEGMKAAAEEDFLSADMKDEVLSFVNLKFIVQENFVYRRMHVFTRVTFKILADSTLLISK